MSSSDLARAAGLKPATVYSRLRLGWSLADALTPLYQKKNEHARKADSLTGRCRAAGVPESRIRRRMDSGMTFEEAVKTPRLKQGLKPNPDSDNQRAKAAGYHLTVIRERMQRRGISFEAALLLPRSKGGGGKPRDPNSLSGKCRAAKISRDRVQLQMDRQGITADIAVAWCKQYPPGTIFGGRVQCVGRADPNSINSKARAAGLSPGCVSQRLKAGLSMQEALRPEFRRRGCAPNPDGLTALAERAGLKQWTIRARVKVSGMSLTEALAHPTHQLPGYLGANIIRALARENGMRHDVVRGRMYRGWTLERALTQKARRPPTHHA